jgi:transcriptional regulator with XRE-family HTH domain
MFLRDRRERLAPRETPDSRRRTPGLRREEVAARAGVSVTWYTWLEQGRGGVPSADVLERLAIALELDAAGREVLFLLAQQRPPPIKKAPAASVSPSLQRVLDSLTTPAYVTTLTWTIVAWNRAAVAVFGDYGTMPQRDLNVMRRIFAPGSTTVLPEHERDRRQTVAAFRVDVARAGDSQEAAELVAELTETSADFRRLWAEHELRTHGVMLKLLVRPGVGEILLESSAFSVDGGDYLRMTVYLPANAASARGIDELVRCLPSE